MSKKYSENHTISAEGFLDISEDGTMSLEIEEIGVKSLADILRKFNGTNIKLSAKLPIDNVEE